MAAGGAGYFHASYFHASYWHDDYWLEAAPVVGAGAPKGGMNLAIFEEILETASLIALFMLVL